MATTCPSPRSQAVAALAVTCQTSFDKLPQGEMATLRSELMANGNGLAQLQSSISDAVSNAISVFFNPAASDVVMEAAIKDILDKLKRDGELLRSGAIAVTVLHRANTASAR